MYSRRNEWVLPIMKVVGRPQMTNLESTERNRAKVIGKGNMVKVP